MTVTSVYIVKSCYFPISLNDKQQNFDKLFIFFPFHAERTIALTNEINGPWPAKRRRGSLYKNMGLLCCVSRPNYL